MLPRVKIQQHFVKTETFVHCTDKVKLNPDLTQSVLSNFNGPHTNGSCFLYFHPGVVTETQQYLSKIFNKYYLDYIIYEPTNKGTH